jgi:hypothetical protein
MWLNRTLVRDVAVDIGAMAIRRLEGIIAWGSRVGNPPVFDPRLFPWARELEANCGRCGLSWTTC